MFQSRMTASRSGKSNQPPDITAGTEHADGLPLPQRKWAILTIALGIIMAVVDGAIANVALPTIAKDLNASPAFSIWIVNGYQLAITISLLPLASLGEIIGYRRIYLSGLLLFTLGSLFCALSHTLLLLTVARIVQGFGAAGIMSVNAALVRFTYPRSMLGRGIGLNALVVAVSAAVGPTAAAAILAAATWPYLFAINLPLGIAALALGWRCLPHVRPAIHAFDWQSALLSAVTFGLGIAAVDSVGHGEAPWFWLFEFGIAAVCGVVLVRRQKHVTAPLLPLDLLRIPIFALSICTSIASFCAQMLAFVAMPFYLESRFGYSAVQMGLLITPWPIAVAIAAPAAGRLVERYPAGLLGGIGLLLFAARTDNLGNVARRFIGREHRLAHGAQRCGVRPVPDAEQSDHDRGSAARAKWRRQWHAGDCASSRTNHGCRAGGAAVGALSGTRQSAFPFGRRCLCADGRCAEHAQAFARGRARRRDRAGPREPATQRRLSRPLADDAMKGCVRHLSVTASTLRLNLFRKEFSQRGGFSSPASQPVASVFRGSTSKQTFSR